MTIKAVLQNGQIQPVEPLPADWADGQALIVEEPESVGTEEGVSQWEKVLEAASATVPADEHDRFARALNEIEQESKDSVRREWGLQ